MNLSVNNVGSIGMASYNVNKNNNQPVSKNYEYDSYSPSFKMGANIQLNGKSRKLIPFLFAALLALACCNKNDEQTNTNYPEEECDCEMVDNTVYSRNYVNEILPSDTLGRETYLEWYDRNLQTEVISPECCPTIEPTDPNWDAKCSIYVYDYNLINHIPKEDTDGRSAYREYFNSIVDKYLGDPNCMYWTDFNILCHNWIFNYLGNPGKCE